MGNKKKVSKCKCDTNDRCNENCSNHGTSCKDDKNICMKGGELYYDLNNNNIYQKIKKISQLLTNWENEDAKLFLDEIYELYGNPYMVKNKRGGFCVWKYDTIPKHDIHEKIILKDESIPHDFPSFHHDFLYSYIQVYIPPEYLTKVQNISGSIGYDPLKKEMYARCASFQANYATLRTVFDVLNDKNTDYSLNINNKLIDEEYNIKYIKEQININSNKYAEFIKLDCYPGAFPDKCKPKTKLNFKMIDENFENIEKNLDDQVQNMNKEIIPLF